MHFLGGGTLVGILYNLNFCCCFGLAPIYIKIPLSKTTTTTTTTFTITTATIPATSKKRLNHNAFCTVGQCVVAALHQLGVVEGVSLLG